MNIYDLTGLLTIADCDTAIKTVSKKIAKLEKKRDFLEHRLEIHQEMVARAMEEIRSLRLDISFLNNKLSWVLAGLPTQECQYHISRAKCRIEFLELRLARYSKPKRLDMQFDLDEIVATLKNAQQFKAELEARCAGLLQADAPALPVAPAEPEPVALIPPAAAEQPAAALKPVARAQPVARLFQKQKGRRFVKGRQTMKRAG
ncbi:hypothetical protein [Niabella sp.]|uniref:hypothetical protein n=1 Tax=Niabella sp. TaxID=1962976 RepID=UPI00260C52A1|nr:hypothetical protein [Niabella sp.]